MAERIFLTFTNASALPYQGAVLGHHIVLNYIDSEGKHYTLEGVPEHKFGRNVAKFLAFVQEERLSSGENNTDSPFKRLRAEKRGAIRLASSLPSTLIAEGDNLRSQWGRMTSFGDEVNSIGYEYRPSSQNSNSFAAGALRRAGFLGPGTVLPEIFDRLFAVDPVSGQTRPMKVPGFDRHLENPLDQTAAPLRGPVAPFIPANASPANDQQDSFDRRFGSSAAESTNPNLPAWMRHVDEIPKVADRRPVPYLGRRVAGKPEPSTFDEGTPAVPFVPPNEVLSSDRPSSLDDRFGNWTASPGGSTPRNPNLALPPAEPGRPPGIFYDKPTPLWTTPPPNRGSTEFSEAPGIGTKPIRYVSQRDGNPSPASAFDTGSPVTRFVLPDQLNSSSDPTDWAAALAGLAARPQRRNAFASGNDALPRATGGGSSSSGPGQPQGPTASALLEYIQRLNQLSGNTPQAPMIDANAPGASLAPSDSPVPMGGLAGRFAALAGIDPDNPDQPVPPPGGLLALLLAGQQRR